MCPMGESVKVIQMSEETQETRPVNEIRSFLRVTGHRSLDELSLDDMCTVSDEIAGHTGIRHA